MGKWVVISRMNREQKATNEYIAHSADGRIQTVREHCMGTTELCRCYAVDVLKELMYDIGLYHDIGKYLDEFQRRINGGNNRVEHSICGAAAIRSITDIVPISLAAQLCIAGHHTGIPDMGSENDAETGSTLYARLGRKSGNYGEYRHNAVLDDLTVIFWAVDTDETGSDYINGVCKLKL